jgi:hypothetical protein
MDFEKALQMWEEDTKNGVVDRLNTAAYPMLGTYALFHEDNRYGADSSEMAEPGWTKSTDELKEELKTILAAPWCVLMLVKLLAHQTNRDLKFQT